ncbi:uncharacterized protein AC631_03281 [Debaryomyces fabryi]|uniref:Uncharacterized protein n=1 Tax=Debaryomyces fabryi TaxID=58627 RepID=A0A0V1PXI8_9ASCO|nr:uncharacterized protein AC631_03281 [Debaryomyces fabryi]KSA00971.1 hypothetical protein AC631_03281 [Debaryomyces fabryi]CUM49760.1 unnamed protein product [Debaryomyces fabryi]
MDPMDCFVTPSSINRCSFNRQISIETNIFAFDDLSPSEGFRTNDDFLFESYRGMDDLASPLTSSESSAQCSKEIFGLVEEEYSFDTIDTIDTYSEFNGGSIVDELGLINEVSEGTIHHEKTSAEWKVVIRFGRMKHKYQQTLLERENIIETKGKSATGEKSGKGLGLRKSKDKAKPFKPSERFNSDIDRSIEEFSSQISNVELDTRIHLEPNFFGLIPLHIMKRDPKYRLTVAKPKATHEDYVNKMNKISKIDNDKYFSRINIHELSHILELDNLNISLTREIELKVLKVFQLYCKFELGHKTWIRDTNKPQRKDLITKLRNYISTWYPELNKFKLEVIIRRGSYSIMQRRLRRERRKRCSAASKRHTIA